MIKFFPIQRKIEETSEQKAIREAEIAKRAYEANEAIRLSVPNEIEKLRKEVNECTAEMDRLESALKIYPDLRKRTWRWGKVTYYTKEVNTVVTDYDIRHNCGCCPDSTLEIFPYISTSVGKIYSDPSCFSVGNADPNYGGDIPRDGWDKEMTNAGISEEIIKKVHHHFQEESKKMEDTIEEINGGSENNETS